MMDDADTNIGMVWIGADSDTMAEPAAHAIGVIVGLLEQPIVNVINIQIII